MAINLTAAHNMPQMLSAAHTHTLYDGSGTSTATGGLGGAGVQYAAGGFAPVTTAARQANFGAGQLFHAAQPLHPLDQPQQKPKELPAMAARRLVKVVIIDPDDKVPLDRCILYTGSEHLTDLTDQELFFEIDIKSILEGHNERRIQLIDKTVKERKEHLEPVKVRDLRMVVVTVATF